MGSRYFPSFPRNRAIIMARQAGRTLQDIGTEHGLTRERVRQIVEHGATNGNYAAEPTTTEPRHPDE